MKPASAKTATAAQAAATSRPGRRPGVLAAGATARGSAAATTEASRSVNGASTRATSLAEFGALVGGLGEQALDQPRQLCGEARPQLVEGWRRLLQDAEIELGEAPGLERGPACEHLVKRGAQRPQVGARIHRLAIDLLGRHVAGCADRLPVRRQRLGFRPLALGGAEVGELGRPGSAVDQDVAGLDVAVDDPRRVGGAERQRDVACDPRGIGDLEPTPVGQQALERPAVDPFHDDEGHPVRDVEVANADNVRVVQRRRRARILEEPVGILPIASHLGPQHLQRHRRLELRMPGREHARHRTLAELLLEQVAADPIPSLHGEAAPRRAAPISRHRAHPGQVSRPMVKKPASFAGPYAPTRP